MAANEPDDDGERGVIVNTASVAAYDGQIGQAAYSASKGGVASLTLTAARDLVGGRHPRVHDRARPHRHAAARHAPRRRSAPRSRSRCCSRSGSARADDFASLALELVRNHYLNGEVIRMDAGIRMPPK